MKKIISLGIASAVLAMTALSASAGVVPATENAVNPGVNITVTFKTDAAVSNPQFEISATGLKYVEKSGFVKGGQPGVTGITGGVNDAGTKVVAMGDFAAGETIATLTYTVDGAVGSNVAIAITNPVNVTGENGSLTEPIVEATTSDSTPSTSDSTPSTSDSTPSTSDSKPESKPNGDNDNAGTGVALAVFPAIIAGAAVVVAKKRK